MKGIKQNKLLAMALLGLILGAGSSRARSKQENRQLVQDFPETLSEIRSRQEELSQQWNQAHTEAEKDRVRQSARELVVQSVIGKVFPAWMGTPWHMGEGDDASMPHQEDKRVSCSMFVTAVLQNVGLRLDDRVRWAHSRALYIQRSLAPNPDDVHRYPGISPRELAERLRKLKAGLYLIGLNCHIGFVVIEDRKVRFVHSNYVDPEEGVVDEPLAESEAIANSQEVGYWITPLFQDDRLIEFWLSGEQVPLQKLGQLRGHEVAGKARPSRKPTGGDAPSKKERSPTIQDSIIAEAEKYLGRMYIFGGRDGRRGCRQGGKRVRCPRGIDCQSLIFFAYEKVMGTRWTRFSVKPSVCIRENQFGLPVKGLDGVLADKLDRGKLRKGDVLFFLLKDYNLDADQPLLVRGEDRYGVWHTGMVHGRRQNRVQVIHARPGDKVLIEPIDEIGFDAIFVVRLPYSHSGER